MLTHLNISNYAITDKLDIELNQGMTVLTGETGAGKSIMLDALGLTLGDRADSTVVRNGAERADVSAIFDIQALPAATKWLAERELDDNDECVLRRVITRDGRSRAYINGQPATLQDVRQLGGLLIDIHSQHAHQSLLRKGHQRDLLDTYADNDELCLAVSQHCGDYLRIEKILHELEHNLEATTAQEQLLRYQLEELERLDVQPGEITELENQQQQLANAEQILAANHHSLQLCREGEDNILSALQQALSSLASNRAISPDQHAATELLESAKIQVEEAARELQHAIDAVDIDPARLKDIEERLDSIYQTARKHRIQPAQLPELKSQLEGELAVLDASDERVEQLRHQSADALDSYRKVAAKLGKRRRKAASELKKQIEEKLAALAMPHCRIEFAIRQRDDGQPHDHGDEDIEILIQTHPSANWGPLSKIASGGELSRISLAIQVVTAQTATLPTVVFDEVDVGIGGATAEIVGQMLSELGKQSQVLCVTHQPQVASQADHHIQVSKSGSGKHFHTVLQALDESRKIEEIARMLGGVAITENTLAHAREMLGIRH